MGHEVRVMTAPEQDLRRRLRRSWDDAEADMSRRSAPADMRSPEASGYAPDQERWLCVGAVSAAELRRGGLWWQPMTQWLIPFSPIKHHNEL
ncbi:hypothetical protein NPIL_472811 [Nephila pilipes]|uniref:Uncharacterized protein n=1 Tax=Nephila pilipes TaxID=299642 RepID=A0A8X6UUK5_NEPPI|nr:hypothetical protein NPIL_472811 [Nephila pilipes]